MAEDAGERAHQSESKKDLRWAAQRSHDRQELANKASNKARESDPMVQKKLKQMQDNTRAVGAEKCKAAIDKNREEKRRQKIARRGEILEVQVMEGHVAKFSDQRVAKFRVREDGASTYDAG